MNDYNDIINVKHFDPKNHKRMSISKRAAQFSPFSALTGYDELIIDTSKDDVEKHDLCEDEFEHINRKLIDLNINKKNNQLVNITYYELDKSNKGKYIKYTGNIKNIDFVNCYISFIDGKKILFSDIYLID